ncbi:hypothetical protein HBH53_034770 [Parastagonospora nodorum]|nr:hypothetical protein HBH53_034770 [Parastagonospora nodorum]KAH3984448.1 hypothetical protein HBH51_024900 [Parastagonospora nodorum]KAH5027715.1 hypothetical protein HBI74_111470 [Parastagonospora nodorum]KAH5205409.1 hypothetical protein HBH77_096420 [Parastagonospora nodorum]KAH5436480.1 hypothetical protein HBI47_070310 [Parastagonospora nodorum]
MKMETKDESCSNVRYGTTISLLTWLGLRSFCSIRRSDGVYMGGIIFSDRRLSKNTYARGSGVLENITYALLARSRLTYSS